MVFPPPVGTVSVSKSDGSVAARSIQEVRILQRLAFSSFFGGNQPEIYTSSLRFSSSMSAYDELIYGSPHINSAVSRKSASTRQEYNIRMKKISVSRSLMTYPGSAAAGRRWCSSPRGRRRCSPRHP